MAISPIDISVMQRSMDVAQIKHNDNVRPMVEQANMTMQSEKNVELRMEQVQNSQESDKSDTRHDAREKGKNFYFGQEEKRKEKDKEAKQDGKVVRKSNISFDMKI